MTSDRADTRVGAYGYSVHDGALLLTQISDTDPEAGFWTLPGGGLSWGEDPEEALHRELWEETGLKGTVEGLLGIDSLVLPAERRPGLAALHSIRIVYRVATSGTPRVTEAGGSTIRARWVPLDELDSLPVVDLVAFALHKAGKSS